jgi:hypothetical protein
MKKVIYFLVCLVFALACSKNEKNQTESGDVKTDTAEYALNLDSAVIYINRYDSTVNSLFKGVPIKAYTIRAVDLLEVMGLSKKTPVEYTHVRAYIGLDLKNKFRLFLTPVKGAHITKGIPGEDVIMKGPHTRGLTSTSVANADGEYVLDFTGPCPNSCPTGSPLNQK